MSVPVPFRAQFRHHRLKGRRVSAEELAMLFGVEVDHISLWVEDGAPQVDPLVGETAPVFCCTEVTRWLMKSEQTPPVRQVGRDPLPPSAQEIADVIGRDRALMLIGQLPPVPGRGWKVCLYVPKRIGPDHPLVAMIGWRDANLMVREFGGMILQPANCRFLHREFRTREVLRLRREGWSVAAIAGAVEISQRQVFNILSAEISPEEPQA